MRNSRHGIIPVRLDPQLVKTKRCKPLRGQLILNWQTGQQCQSINSIFPIKMIYLSHAIAQRS